MAQNGSGPKTAQGNVGSIDSPRMADEKDVLLTIKDLLIHDNSILNTDKEYGYGFRIRNADVDMNTDTDTDHRYGYAYGIRIRIVVRNADTDLELR